MKTNRVLSTHNLHTDEVTAVTMNESENTMVVGFKDGLIKILNIEREFECRESNLAFSAMSQRKGQVS